MSVLFLKASLDPPDSHRQAEHRSTKQHHHKLILEKKSRLKRLSDFDPPKNQMANLNSQMKRELRGFEEKSEE
jgi:hypothetical protein